MAVRSRGAIRAAIRDTWALLTDFKQRGLFESTLVTCRWVEFGRLPLAQKGATPGLDHHPHAFTAWRAGGGAKGGVQYGETDEVGHKAAVDKVSVNDLHATILALLGLEYEKLTYFFNGRILQSRVVFIIETGGHSHTSPLSKPILDRHAAERTPPEWRHSK